MNPPGTLRDLVVIGASAGGVEALRSLVSGLPADLPAGVLIVLHLPPGGTSALAGILGAACPLPTTVAEHGAEIEPGHVYVAPPDHHLLVDGRHMRLSAEPPENGHRPAVDALFRSAAGSRGQAVAGIVLSGALDDGTAGLVAIRLAGGLTIVQRPDEAAYRGHAGQRVGQRPGRPCASRRDHRPAAGTDPAPDPTRFGRSHVCGPEALSLRSRTTRPAVRTAVLSAARTGRSRGAGRRSGSQYGLSPPDQGGARATDGRFGGHPPATGDWPPADTCHSRPEETGKAAELLRSRLTVGQSEASAPKTGESR